MPSSVATSEEFNALSLRVTLAEESISKLNQRLIAAENAIKALQAVPPTPTPTPTPTPIPPPSPTTLTTLYDDFNYNYTFTKPNQISTNGKWRSISGTINMDTNGLVLSGTKAQVQSTYQCGDATLDYDVTTETTGNASMMLFRYLDSKRHYYFTCKSTGCEFGKKDQSDIAKIIASGGISTPINTKRHVTIEAIKDRFRIWVDSTLVIDLTDVSSFKSGSFSPYTEGSRARYNTIKITTK